MKNKNSKYDTRTKQIETLIHNKQFSKLNTESEIYRVFKQVFDLKDRDLYKLEQECAIEPGTGYTNLCRIYTILAAKVNPNILFDDYVILSMKEYKNWVKEPCPDITPCIFTKIKDTWYLSTKCSFESLKDTILAFNFNEMHLVIKDNTVTITVKLKEALKNLKEKYYL